MDFLKALVASVCPQKHRNGWRQESSSSFTHAAFVSGLFEFLIFGYFEFLQFRNHFLAVADYFAQGNETTQTAALFIMVVSEFFYPLSLLLIVLSAEGFLRAVDAAITGQAMPSVFISFRMRIWDRLHRNVGDAIAR